ncbi:CMRF35-like molecule 7 [Alligator sinensis]|uniref:CMRF35-like molecule 7 n=1 Tax=Alligator sinensis TaxID=38654 RepID=A0A3Q0G5N1_ALLSI|nr:CMRF35-like molecule 7 [Alligator sinensis]
MWALPLWLWILFPGCMALIGPEIVTGPEGGSVSVTCKYNRGHEKNGKLWCRAGPSSRCSSGEHTIHTNWSEANVQKGRLSLQDNHILRTFTITMEHLTKADAGTYLCGVLIAFSSDLRHAVEVTVSPVLSPMEPPVSTEFTASIFTWRISTESQVSGFPAVHNMSQSSQDSHIHFVLLVGLKVPVFLCMVCTVVWVSVRYRGSSND